MTCLNPINSPVLEIDFKVKLESDTTNEVNHVSFMSNTCLLDDIIDVHVVMSIVFTQQLALEHVCEMTVFHDGYSLRFFSELCWWFFSE